MPTNDDPTVRDRRETESKTAFFREALSAAAPAPVTKRKRSMGLKPARVVTIGLIITEATNDGFELRLPPEVPISSQGYLVFRNHGHDGFLINFTIDDGEGIGRDYFFPDDRDDAMWVQKVSGDGACPDDRCHWGQFKAIDVDATGKTLTVRNKNGHPQYFGFALRVGEDRNNPTLTFDPVGDNQNGQAS